jgi:competence protein ComEC
VRVSLHGTQGYLDPQPGLTVILTGHLSPPEGPVEPGAFDFRRMAWFDGLGAVGYTRTPALVLAPPEPASFGMAIFRLRMAISAHVRAAIPGEPGGFVAAILTGDRSGIARETTDALRGSNLAHLLAISGLHMGLLTGFVFAALRYGIALIPPLALRLSSKKLAAISRWPPGPSTLRCRAAMSPPNAPSSWLR